MPPRVCAIVPAAGQGLRLGAGPKAFVHVRGEPLLRHAVRRLVDSGEVDEVVVAIADTDRPRAERCLAGLDRTVRFVTGGTERTDSVRGALATVDRAEFILVHDAARGLAPPSVIGSVVQALRRGSPAAIPVVAVPDTVKQVDPGGWVRATLDRSSLRAAQTPQGFALDTLRSAYHGAAAATDDAALVEALGVPVATVPGHPHAFKITTPLDLVLAESVAAEPTCGGPR